MQRSDTGDFCVLYIEPNDEKAALFQVIMEQKKPIVILLSGKGAITKPEAATDKPETHLFQRPEDFAELKHLKRHLDVPVLFVISGSEHLIQLAGRHGFPVYLSMDALADAIAAGHQARSRTAPRRTVPLSSSPHHVSPKKTVELQPPDEPIVLQRTASLLATGPSSATAQTANGGLVNSGLVNRAPTREDAVPVAAMRTNGFANGLVNRAPAREEGTSPDAARSMNSAPTVRTVPFKPAVHAPAEKSRFNRLAVGVLLLLLFALITAGLGYFLLVSHNLPADAPAMTNVIVGHISFLSSNQLSQSSSQGLNDKVLVDLNNLPKPAIGKNYYAWLLTDKNQSDTKATLLGTLLVNNGHAQLLYPGDQAHTNLLGITSRFLVTEEDAAMTPLTPSPDYSSWRYYGEFSQTPINSPDNTKHFSYLDHLRHLLASDPTLDELELPGGLNTWFYRNVSKILEWTGSTREQWQDTNDVGFVRRQTLRTLTYLDGVSFVSQDLPPNTGLNVNERIARIGLLEVGGPAQDPPCYLAHISHHLYGLLQSGSATPDLRKNAAAIINALDNVKFWLEQVRHDALQIMKMTDQQLRQPATLSLLNDMIDNATHAFIGQTDPTTGQMRQGVTWIHDQIQSLATFEVKHITANGPALQLVPNTNVRRATLKLYIPTDNELRSSFAQSVGKEVQGGNI